ncbi:hypothetical protein TanjilG_21440 [Lupinus angustifolius]|uniref:Uncharacterized protein n=1 Tax=Lupinus angustifolius TaxID=3871 RepID=A0A4P1RNK8_LUPAN|nr:hypothetical protein TanjilG_21440 [Lupinus angustifolius]
MKSKGEECVKEKNTYLRVLVEEEGVLSVPMRRENGNSVLVNENQNNDSHKCTSAHFDCANSWAVQLLQQGPLDVDMQVEPHDLLHSPSFPLRSLIKFASNSALDPSKRVLFHLPTRHNYASSIQVETLATKQF